MKYPNEIQNLIESFTQLPTVGPKTAERYVFYLLKQPQNVLSDFAEKLNALKSNMLICKECMVISNTSPCPICFDKSRNREQICIVENLQDMLVIENTNKYNGLYYIIGGKIDVINGYENKLNTKRLLERMRDDDNSGIKIKEIIMALDPTLEGETTTKYLIKLLEPYNVKITRLARGLSMGSNLEYADSMTIINAFNNRS